MAGLFKSGAPVSLQSTKAIPRPTVPASPSSKGKVAFIVGHNYKDQGAINFLGETEYCYNSQIAREASQIMASWFEKTCYIIFRPPGSYSAQVRHVVREVKRLGVEVAIELHFNAYSQVTNGTEALVVDNSVASASLALELTSEIADEYGTVLRGIKGVRKIREGHSGYKMLHGLHKAGVTSTIVEPVFGNFSTAEAMNFFSKSQEYAILLARVLNKIGYLKPL